MDLAILFALDREAQPFRKSLRSIRPLPLLSSPTRPTWLCHTSRKIVLVTVTGPGYQAADEAIQQLLEQYEPKLVVAAGYAGGLSPQFGRGEVVVASQVIDEHETTWRTSIPAELGDVPCGTLLTWPRVVAMASEKQHLGKQYQALMVDMESAAIVDHCAHQQVPVAVVRAITDDCDTSLSPRLASLLGSGTLTPRQALVALVRHPGLLPEFWQLGRVSADASRNLARALRALV